MKQPVFDEDGYPTEETLKTIINWRFNTFQDFIDCMDFVGIAWTYPKYWHVEKDQFDPDFPNQRFRRYVFSTGGWLGNESLVGAIEKNIMLQSVGAWSWRRGGHYEYRIPEKE